MMNISHYSLKKLKESKLILVRSINSVQIIAGTDVLAILFKLNSVFFLILPSFIILIISFNSIVR
jgi:hypothetical protein